MWKRALRVALALAAMLPHVGAELAKLGACYDVSTNRATCAFNASWCPSDQAWKTPTALATLAGVDGCGCATTGVGSCYDYVSTHISTCHPHPAQCPAGHSWVDAGYVFSDGSECLCTTDRLNGATAYGACVAAGGVHRCGIDGAHCAADETWLDPTEAVAQYDITCDCSDVRTGSCVDALTSTPRCTVDADSCDAGDTWVDAVATEAGGTTCVLCDSVDLVWPTAQPTTALMATTDAGGAGGTEFGACYDASLNVRRCEYNSTYCVADEIWMAPSDLASSGLDACYCASTEIGACYDVMVTHVATCHVHANQCPDTYLWIASGYEYAGGHTCTCDENRNTGMTQYGACMDTTGSLPSATCAYQKSDCIAGETWLEPKDALALYDFECHCDDVLLGACAVAGLTTCAVDVDSCAAGATWLSARDVYDAGTHCRLCTLSTPAPTPTPAEANAVAGSFTVTGLSVADATSHEDVFRAAIATLARVSADDVSVAFTEGSERRRRLLDHGVVVDYVVAAATPAGAIVAAESLAAASVGDVTAALLAAADAAGVATAFAAVAVVSVSQPDVAAPAPAPAKKDDGDGGTSLVVILLVVVLVVLVGIGGCGALMWFRHQPGRPGDQSPRAVVPLAEARQLELATNVRSLAADTAKGVPVSGEADMLPL